MTAESAASAASNSFLCHLSKEKLHLFEVVFVAPTKEEEEEEDTTASIETPSALFGAGGGRLDLTAGFRLNGPTAWDFAVFGGGGD